MRQQCAFVAKKSNTLLGWLHQEERCQQVEGGDPSHLLSTGEVMSGVTVMGPWYNRNMDLVEQVQPRATRMISISHMWRG